MKKTIIIYFSQMGNTKAAAKKLAQKTGFDIEEIVPVKPFPNKLPALFMTGGGQATLGKCPQLRPIKADLSQYDEIILGTPIWAGKCASPINTFIKENAVSSKVKAVFTCSSDGENKRCIEKLKKKLPAVSLTVGLADKSSKQAADNDQKIEEFASSL